MGGIVDSVVRVIDPLDITGIQGAGATRDAARAQRNATNDAIELQREQFERQIELQKPFREAGLSAQNRLLDLLGLSNNTGAQGYGRYARDFSMDDFEQDPGYDFRLKEGLKGLDRQAAARGGLISGGALKAAARYGQEMGSQEYQNAFNRYQVNRSNQLNPLQGFLNQAQSSTNTLGQASQDYANRGADLRQDLGNIRASSYIGQHNANMAGVNRLLDIGGIAIGMRR